MQETVRRFNQKWKEQKKKNRQRENENVAERRKINCVNEEVESVENIIGFVCVTGEK